MDSAMPTGLFQAGIHGPGWHILPENSLCYGLPPTQLGATSNAWNRAAIWSSGAPWLASCCRLETPFRRKELCSKVQKIVAEDLPYIPLWYTDVVSVHRKSLGDIALTPTGDYEFLVGR